MQQIADWLKELGLSEYAERFAENGIDVSVLPHLSDQDLKDPGVLLGHRRKMLAAIGESSNKPSAPASAPGAGSPTIPAPMPTAEATVRLTSLPTEAAGRSASFSCASG
jgi:SAM domain (Sterile alpha motif)